MDRTALESRLSHVAAVRRHLPELADKLESLGLIAAEEAGTNVVEIWKKHDGPRLTAPKDLGGLGATCVETLELQRGIGYLSPSLAAATTMHYLSVAGLADFATTTDEATVGLIKSLIENRTVFASGFSEGTIAGSVFRPTMEAAPADGGYTVTGQKKPCSLADSMDCIMASVLLNDTGQRAITLIWNGSPGLSVAPLWTSSPLSAAQTHAVIFEDVFVPNELMMVSDVEDPDGRNEKSGYVLFGLIITAGYVGAATRLALKLADRSDFTEADFVELFSPIEGVWRALRMIAERYDAGDRSDALFADLLWIRLGLRDQLQPSVARIVSRVGGVAFATDPEIAYLASCISAYSFHPPTVRESGAFLLDHELRGEISLTVE
ncbi:acyl-CoA dehydrogenase family protein [Mycobacteroides salmoniphilum]|uniref:acyl-CoA dehydrogenase family protein n=1 Tax=Mycobacteroides salmoniphilum TaxID=404941 RepID=UPI00106665B1|nr:acyl-CoA dehydrogenase family protein [Mycobacteroides salmoniphilum]TDZ76354.1 putative acyl-CoA dehydrogenase YdbM [Mycobacteroides salmoniphilum]TDZ84872.1 putative acyl-CoA dehydrogenase YdbM [Mycobacteroides salmoniphilum]